MQPRRADCRRPAACAAWGGRYEASAEVGYLAGEGKREAGRQAPEGQACWNAFRVL